MPRTRIRRSYLEASSAYRRHASICLLTLSLALSAPLTSTQVWVYMQELMAALYRELSTLGIVSCAPRPTPCLCIRTKHSGRQRLKQMPACRPQFSSSRWEKAKTSRISPHMYGAHHRVVVNMLNHSGKPGASVCDAVSCRCYMPCTRTSVKNTEAGQVVTTSTQRMRCGQ